ncbi:MAG: DUF983 domain-containing protein [Planctomycetia bacterium]
MLTAPRIMPEQPSRVRAFSRAARLRCPRCGHGPLFRGVFRMHAACPHCGFSYEREPGFYLGSIYLNYGATVILTGAAYALLVMGLGFSNETTLGICLAAAVCCPILFFRHARSFLLALDSSVNQNQAGNEAETGDGAASASALSSGTLASLASDDGRAGCAMGVALALILLFGLGMAAVTLSFTAGSMEPDGDFVPADER